MSLEVLINKSQKKGTNQQLLGLMRLPGASSERELCPQKKAGFYWERLCDFFYQDCFSADQVNPGYLREHQSRRYRDYRKAIKAQQLNKVVREVGGK